METSLPAYLFRRSTLPQPPRWRIRRGGLKWSLAKRPMGIIQSIVARSQYPPFESRTSASKRSEVDRLRYWDKILQMKRFLLSSSPGNLQDPGRSEEHTSE